MKILRRFIKDSTIFEMPDYCNGDYYSVRNNNHHLVTFRGENWEFITYDDDNTKKYEVILTYGPYQSINGIGNFNTVGPSCPNIIKCQCGAGSCNHPGHSHWCDVLHKNGWDEAVKDYVDLMERLEKTKLEPAQKQTPNIDLDNGYYFSSGINTQWCIAGTGKPCACSVCSAKLTKGIP